MGRREDDPERGAGAEGDIEALLALAVDRRVIDEDQAAALRALRTTPPAPAPPPPSLEDEARRARQVRRREEQARFDHEQRALRDAREREAREERERHEQRAREKARQVGARAALAIGHAGDEWLQVVDGADGASEADFRREVLPLIYENVGWLVGTLLVLAGSVYGLREAWITFDAVGRWASVAGALFTYHALFVIVGAVLARRSGLAGQFLASIGACLLPIAFVAVANLSAESRLFGGVGTVALAAASVATLASVGRRFGVGSGLVPAMLLPALTMVAYPHLASPGPLRFLLPLVALAATGLITLRETTRRSLGALALVLYAAVASELFALSSNAPDAMTDAGPMWRIEGPVFGAWLGAFVAALGLSLFAVRRMQPANQATRRVLAVVVWLGFALTAGAGALAAFAALRAASPPRASVLIALGAALGACALARWLTGRRSEAFHALLLLASATCAVACRVFLPADGDRLWWALAAFAPGALHLAGVSLAPAPARGAQTAVAFAMGAALFVWSFEPARSAIYPITLLCAAALALGCHRQGARTDIAGWHYVGATIAAVGVAAGISRAPNVSLLGLTYVGLAVTYATAAAVAAIRSAPDRGTAHGAADDISLLLFVVAAFASLRALTISPAFMWSPQVGLQVQPGVIAGALPLSAASLGLLLRSLRDRSALPSALGALGLAAAGFAVAGPRTLGAATLVFGVLALACCAIAAALTPGTRTPTLARTAFGGIELPWAWSGRGAIGQGFGVVMVPLAVLTATWNVGWLAARGDDRAFAIMGGLALALACVVTFATHAAASFRWRGQSGLLWALAAAAVLVAVTNRIGRPLPPTIVGRNLTLVGIGVWLAALGFARVGPWLADKLGAPDGEGERYARVPQAGVIALAALLVVDALVVGPVPLYRGLGVIPPSMLLGPALLLFLLRRSVSADWTFAASVPLVAVGCALVGAQRHIIGPSLAQLGGPGGTWVPAATASLAGIARYGGWQAVPDLYRGAIVGLAVAAAGYGAVALASRRRPMVAGVSWAAAALIAGLVCALGLWVTSVIAAAVVLITSIGVARRWPSFAPLALTVATVLVVHACAQATPAVPLWSGVALGALTLAAAITTHLTLASASDRTNHLHRGHVAVTTLALLAVIHGFAHGGTNAELTEGWSVIGNGFIGLARWGGSPVPAVALALAAGAFLIAAVSWNACVRRVETAAHTTIASALATFALATWALSATRVAGAERLIVIATAAMLVALPLQAATALLGERFEDLVRACRQTRDHLMVVSASLVALGAVTINVPAWPHTPLAALATLAAISALSLLALIIERRPRHVYFLGTALFGSYGLARTIGATSSTPADDAVLLLVLDFALIGVTVALRRRRLDDLATATRRFAAALPIVIALILPWQATRETGLLSLGASVFYGVLAWVERDRILGTLGAVAVNLAILVLSLSQGLRGFEIYLAPIGLCTLIVVHLFADSMAAEVRNTLRFIATGFTYAPAAIALVLQVGSAQSDYYSLGFAAACVAGIGAGVWLRVRAYLVLGFSFLILDLGTELVRASLRNQRLGFFALSLAGLVILSAMAAYTLQREKLRLRFVRLRRALATWE